MTQHLTRPEGTIGYDVIGEGPLIVCVPGMGDLRSSYRSTAPALVAAGYRVAAFDLRGHGDSSTDFSRYDDEAAASDILALIDELGDGPAVVLGNSMGAAAAVLAAAQRPEAVAGLVLLGPFVRNPAQGRVATLLFQVALRGFWGRAVWRAYFKSLSPGGEPVDTAEHQRAVRASLQDPGRWRAFQLTATKTSHEGAEQALPAVVAPTLVVMGTADRDFPDPAAEANWIASAMRGTALMIDGAGHYPMAERPDLVNPALLAFLAEAAPRAVAANDEATSGPVHA